MTTLQKTVIVAAIAATAGAGVFAAYQNSKLRGQIKALQQQREDAMNQLAELQAENSRPESLDATVELSELRGEIGWLRQQTNELMRALQTWQVGSITCPTNFLPRESWRFAGYGTPDAAVESRLWAKSVGNVKLWLNGIASEEAYGATHNYFQGQTDAQRSQFLINQSKLITGYQILSEIPLADDEVMVQLGGETADGRNIIDIEVMKDFGGEWKLYDEYIDNGFFQAPKN